jgi:hypothetical protein
MVVRYATAVSDTVSEQYDYELSTEESHAASSDEDGGATGEFEVLRETLDSTYHSRYSKERQRLQDNIVRQLLCTVVEDAKTCVFSDRPKEPWIVFTAGAMGVGKSHCMRWLSEKGLFSLASFVQVDPDIIRFELPEMKDYLSRGKTTAGTLTQKEAGFIAEILTLAGLESGKNVMVDGSLRDAKWNALLFQRIRKDYPKYKIAIIHVVANPQEVLRRAAARAEKTGRVVPEETLLATLEEVPRSVAKLGPLTDYTICINTDGPEPIILTERESWTTFSQRWKQKCDGSVAPTVRMVNGFTPGFTVLHGLWGDESKTREVERMKVRSLYYEAREHLLSCLPGSDLPPFQAMRYMCVVFGCEVNALANFLLKVEFEGEQ